MNVWVCVIQNVIISPLWDNCVFFLISHKHGTSMSRTRPFEVGT